MDSLEGWETHKGGLSNGKRKNALSEKKSGRLSEKKSGRKEAGRKEA